MEECHNGECRKYNEVEDNNCEEFNGIGACGDRILKADKEPVAKLQFERCLAVDEKMLARAVQKAVELGLIEKWVDEERYLKNWSNIKAVLQAAVGN